MLANDLDADGNALTAVLVSGVSHGSLTLNGDGSFSYIPSANYHGADSFSYKVNDAAEDSAPVIVSLTVTVGNDAPQAAADSYTIAQNGALSVGAPGVTGNDVDVDGDTLSAVLVSGVTQGAIAFNPDGSFVYTPAAGYIGADSFSYKVNDGTADSVVVTVSISVTSGNSAPVAAANSYTVQGGSPLVVGAPGVLGNDTDADNNSLTATVVTGPAHGTLTLNSNGSFSYTAVSGYAGPDSFTYRANDGSVSSAAAIVSITVTAPPPPNRPPTLIVPKSVPTSVFTSANFTVTATDLDGDAVTITLFSPANGTITGTGPVYTYTPIGEFSGNEYIGVTANDGRGGVVSKVIRAEVSAEAATVGRYSIFLRDADEEIVGYIYFTVSRLNRVTGVLSIGATRYDALGFVGGAPRSIKARKRGLDPVVLGLTVDRADPVKPVLQLTVTDGGKVYTGGSARSPYSPTNPAPQNGKYTVIASRDSLVLDRVGYTLQDPSQDVPKVASSMTIAVNRLGWATIRGHFGNGAPFLSSGWVMEGGNLPFYFGFSTPSHGIQYSMLKLPLEPAPVSGTASAPAITGSLRWIAGVDRRIAVPFDADYAVLGGRFQSVRTGPELLNSAELTMSAHIPSFVDAGRPSPYEETREFIGSTMHYHVSNISILRFSFATGSFMARLSSYPHRVLHGVIIQGEGIHRGLGSVADVSTIGSVELLPVAAPIPAEGE